MASADQNEKDLRKLFGAAKRTHKDWLMYQKEVEDEQTKLDGMDTSDDKYKQTLGCYEESKQMVQNSLVRLKSALESLQDFLDCNGDFASESMNEARTFMADKDELLS